MRGANHTIRLVIQAIRGTHLNPPLMVLPAKLLSPQAGKLLVIPQKRESSGLNKRHYVLLNSRF